MVAASLFALLGAHWYSFDALIIPKFGYFGFAIKPIALPSQVGAVLFTALIAIALPRRIDRLSHFFVYTFTIVVYLPAIVALHRMEYLDISEAQTVAAKAALTASLLILCFFSKIPRKKISTPNLGLSLFALWAVPIVVLSVVFVYWRLSQNFSIIDLVNVYDKRLEAAAASNVFTVYLLPWMANILLPLLFVFAWRRKRYLLLAFVACNYFYLFFVGGAKLYAIAPLLLLASCFYFQRSIQRSGDVKGATTLVLCAVLLVLPAGIQAFSEQLAGGMTYIINLRTFAIQGVAVPVYIDFFSNNPFTQFTHVNFMAIFGSRAFDRPLALILNDVYQMGNFNSAYFMGDGYSAFGFWGMIVMSVLVGSYIYLLDVLSVEYPIEVVCPLVIVFMMSFANVPFFTSLFTGGGILLIVLFLTLRPTLVDGRPGPRKES